VDGDGKARLLPCCVVGLSKEEEIRCCGDVRGGLDLARKEMGSIERGDRHGGREQHGSRMRLDGVWLQRGKMQRVISGWRRRLSMAGARLREEAMGVSRLWMGEEREKKEMVRFS